MKKQPFFILCVLSILVLSFTPPLFAETCEYQQQSYASGDVNLDIPFALSETEYSVVYSSIDITEPAYVRDIDVQLTITYTGWVQFLAAYLISPSGTTITLFDGAGGKANDFPGTTLDDDDGTIAVQDLTTDDSPFDGIYTPNEALSAFDGEIAQGEWQLMVVNKFDLQSGTLNSWQIDLCYQNEPNVVPVARNDTVTTEYQNPIDIYLLLNDVNLNGDADALVIEDITQPSFGTLTVSDNNKTVTYSPGTYVGQDSFTYSVSNGITVSDPATVKVNVTSNLLKDGGFERGVSDSQWESSEMCFADNTPITESQADAYLGYWFVRFTGGFKCAQNSFIQQEVVIPASPKPNLLSFLFKISDPASVPATLKVMFTNEDHLVFTATQNDVSAYRSWKKIELDIADLPVGTYDLIFRFTSEKGDIAAATSMMVDEIALLFVPESVEFPPVANIDYVSMPFDDPATTIDVLANDSDPNNEALTVNEITQIPAYGVAEISTDGKSIIYTPNQSYQGDVMLSYTVINTSGIVSDPGSVVISLLGSIGTPTAADDSVSMAYQDPPLRINVLNNDEDPNGMELTVAGVTTPTAGTAEVSSDRKAVIYSPDRVTTGDVTFTYTITNGTNTSAPATVTVTLVGDTVELPVAVNDTATMPYNSDPFTIDVLDNDYDPNTPPLSIKVNGLSYPSQGSVRIIDNGQAIEYTPNRSYFGTVRFSYTITNGIRTSNWGRVTIMLTKELDLTDVISVLRTLAGLTTSLSVNDENNDFITGLEEAIAILQKLAEIR